MKRQTVSQIIASRLKEIRDKRSQLAEKSQKQHNQIPYITSKLNTILDKDQLDNEDKAFLLQYMEGKQRVNFSPKFPSNNFKWLIVKNKTLIDENYNFTKKSFYLFKGRLFLCQTANPPNKTELSFEDYKGAHRQFLLKDKEGGIGVVFEKKVTPKCLVFAEQAFLLCLQHNSNQLKLIQTNCLMTSKEKQEMISRFSLFQDINDLKKNYLPHFRAKKYVKGDIIYEIGQLADSLYLIVEGEVQFLYVSQAVQAEQKQDKSPLKHLRNKHSQKQSVLMAEKLGPGCYFGEQDTIKGTLRNQTAKCFSAWCVLLIVGSDFFQKLLSTANFTQQIKAKCTEKQRERQTKFQNLTKVKSFSPQSSACNQQNYNLFKTKLLNRLQEPEKVQTRKLSLRRSKQKIMHGHTIKLPRDNCKTEQQGQSFSMLRVNENMYLKTLKRFRHSLKEIQQQKKPKKKTEIGEGRSLQKVWHLLGLKQIFSDSQDQDESRELAKQTKSRTYYDHIRYKKNIYNNGGLRPKGLTTNCRLKRQYLQYLQNCS